LTRPPVGRRAAATILVAAVVSTVAAFGTGSPPLAGPTRLRGEACPTAADLQVTGEVRLDGIDEVSGVVASRRTPGLYWIEEDSGNPARIWGVDLAGNLLASVRVGDAINLDWEDIALARGRIWVADIGDNLLLRPSIAVYSFPEPDPSARSVRADVLTLVYPDGPHNAEALFVDGKRGQVFVVTKEAGVAEVFRAVIRDLTDGAVRGLRSVIRLPLNRVTAADLGPAGVMIKAGTANLYRWGADRRVSTALSREPCPISAGPGEAIAFARTPSGVVAIPEGSAPPIYLTPVDL
jgi:hypothetical protein